jgi:ribosomal protein S12 methylthiotransferase accessory factor
MIDIRPATDDLAILDLARRRLLGPAGPLVAVTEALAAPDDVGLFVGHSVGWAPRQHPACPDGRVEGTGVGLTRPAALASTVGELVERYAAWRCCRTDSLRATHEEVASRAVASARFILYADEQYAQPGFHFAPPGSSQLLAWAEAWSVTRRERVLVPSEFVYMERCAGTGCLAHSVTTGLACGASPEAAAVAALGEAIERDGIMIAWLGALELPRLRPPAEDAVVGELLTRIDRQGLRATVLDASTDIAVPVRIAVLEEASGPPREVAVGMAAHLDPARAHRKALMEAAHTHNWLRRLKRQRTRWEHPHAVAPRSFEDHVFLWGHEPMARQLDFWRCGPWRDEASGGHLPQGAPALLGALVEKLAAAGFESLLVDLTPLDLADVGLRVVRAVVPGLVPLTVGPPCLGGSRRTAVPARLGLTARHTGADWNRLPHPFP